LSHNPEDVVRLPTGQSATLEPSVHVLAPA